MRIYLLIMAIALVGTYLATPVIRMAALRSGALTPVRERDVHTVPVPRLGGVAMLAGAALALTVASQVPFLEGVFAESLPWAVLGAGALICLLGVVDDLWDLDWMTKLVGQVLVAGLVAWQGVQLVSLPIFGLTIGSPRLSLLVTVVVIVLIMNAVNWVDGLDGLAAGLMAIAGIAFFVYSYALTVNSNPGDYSNTATTVIAVLVGVCLGFLPHNFFPARIFMGDSGALFLGVIVAAASILVTGQVDPAVVEARLALPAFLPFLLPIAMILLPLADVAITSLRRILKGKSPFHADRTHLHHRIMDRGHSHRRTVLILYAWAAVVAFTVAALAIFPPAWVLPPAVLALAAAVVFTVRRPPSERGTLGA